MQNVLIGPEIPPLSDEAPKSLVIFLHGFGSNGDDLIGLVPQMQQYLPYTYFMSPNAPFPCKMVAHGFQWFDLSTYSEEALLAGVEEVAPILNDYIDNQLSYLDLEEDQLALIGFSQGTMTALYTALRRENACAGVIGYSGALIAPHLLETELASKPDICLIHGTEDEVVPFDNMVIAESALKAQGIRTETHSRPNLGHGIDAMGLEIGIKFLQERLQ